MTAERPSGSPKGRPYGPRVPHGSSGAPAAPHAPAVPPTGLRRARLHHGAAGWAEPAFASSRRRGECTFRRTMTRSSAAGLYLDIQRPREPFRAREASSASRSTPTTRRTASSTSTTRRANPFRSRDLRASGARPTRTRADPGSEDILLEFAQPYTNHNGGHASPSAPTACSTSRSATAGAATTPRTTRQNLGNLLGKILRIDAGRRRSPPTTRSSVVAGARGEIWAFGLRNPWRFSFDRAGHALGRRTSARATSRKSTSSSAAATTAGASQGNRSNLNPNKPPAGRPSSGRCSPTTTRSA